ncbi:phosphoadenylyl-sulfate reductase, partial [Kitasatospora sp. NPDC006786]
MSSTTTDYASLAERAGRELEEASAQEVLAWAAETFG